MQNDFQQLADWSEEEYALLPWRQNRTLYTTLVSEIMLQQTTVSTVLPKFSAFLKTFPNIDSLAVADDTSLRAAWQGLGYYRRAVNLLKAAKSLQNIDFPQEEDELQQINGVGPYTASALRAIGHDLPALAVDGNLKRVLSRYFEIFTPYEKGLDQDIRHLLNDKKFLKILTDIGPRKINEALMDLGRVICRVKNPLCLTCPLNANCKSRQNNTQEQLPVRTKKAQKLIDLHLLRFLVINDNNEILLYQKNAKEWLTDQWEVPTAALENPQNFKQYPISNAKIPASAPLKTGITKYRIYNYAVNNSESELLQMVPAYKERQLTWFPLSELPHISTATTKILKKQKLL